MGTLVFNLNEFNFNQSILNAQGRVIDTWAGVLNRAGPGMGTGSSHDTYVLGNDAVELDRLRLQHDLWRPTLQAALGRAGLSPGERVIDLGAGPGFVAQDRGPHHPGGQGPTDLITSPQPLRSLAAVKGRHGQQLRPPLPHQHLR